MPKPIDDTAQLGKDRIDGIFRWEQAITMASTTDPEERARVFLGLCEACLETGRWERAQRAAQHAIEFSEKSGFFPLIARAWRSSGDSFLRRGLLEDAEQAYHQVNAIMDAHDLKDLAAGLALRWAELAMLRGETTVVALAKNAAILSEAHSEALKLGRALAIEAVGLAQSGQHHGIDMLLDRASQPARIRGHAVELMEIRLLSARAWIAAGRITDGLAQATQAAAFADEIGHGGLRLRADALIADARSKLEANSRDVHLDRLLELVTAMPRLRDPINLLESIVDTAFDLLDGDRVVVWRLDGDLLERVAIREREPELGPFIESVIQLCIHEQREVVISDFELRAKQGTDSNLPTFILCLPLTVGRKLLGVLYVDARRSPPHETTDLARLGRALAAHAAVALDQARRDREAETHSERARTRLSEIHAPLTSLLTAAAALRDARDEVTWHEELVAGILALGRQILEEVEQEILSRENWRSVDLALLSQEILNAIAWDARRKGVLITVDADESAWVFGDPDELNRAFSSLLRSNLTRAPAGSAIQLSVHIHEEEALWLLISPSTEAQTPHPEALMARRVFAEHRGRWSTDIEEDRLIHTVTLPIAIGVNTN